MGHGWTVFRRVAAVSTGTRVADAARSESAPYSGRSESIMNLHHLVRRKRTRHLLFAAAFLTTLIGCSSKPPSGPDPARPVKTSVVTAGDDLHTRSFPGKAEASRNATLAF